MSVEIFEFVVDLIEGGVNLDIMVGVVDGHFFDVLALDARAGDEKAPGVFVQGREDKLVFVGFVEIEYCPVGRKGGRANRKGRVRRVEDLGVARWLQKVFAVALEGNATASF